MIDLTDKNFETEVIKAKTPVLVDFWAAWCGPCQIADPVIDELDKEYNGQIKFAKLNVDQNPQSPQKYGVMSIPTVIIFKEGQEFKRQVGFSGKAGYQKLLEKAIK